MIILVNIAKNKTLANKRRFTVYMPNMKYIPNGSKITAKIKVDDKQTDYP